MDIKNFIKESLIQIAEGVKEAQQHMLDNKVGAVVNKLGVASGGKHVEFDLGVTVSQGESHGGSGKIDIVGMLKIGGGIETTGANQTVSRIKFSVPIELPTQEGDKSPPIV